MEKPELLAPPTPSGAAPRKETVSTPAEERPAAVNWLEKFAFSEGEPEPAAAEVPAPAEVKPAEAPIEQPAAQAKPKEEVSVTEPAPAEASITPEAKTPEEPAVAPVLTEKPAEAPKSAQVEEWNKIRAEATAQLEKVYAFDEAAKDTLGEDMAKQLPPMAARLHMNVYEAVMNAVYSVLPNVIRNIQSVDRARSDFDTQFYNRWPGLKSHSGDVQRAAQVYVQLNPRASAQQVIDEVGLQVSIMRKLPIPGLSPAPAAAPQVAPSFRPAAPSAGGLSAATPLPHGKYEQFVTDEE